MTKYENIEAEQVIIGSAIMNNSLLLNIADILEEKHFYYEEHKIIWREFIRIGKEGGTADPVTLKGCLNNVAFKHLGGSKYLSILIQLASGTADIRGYAKTLIELWKKRELEVLIENCKESLQDKNFDYLSSKLQNDMLKLDSNNPVQKVQHISEVITDIENDERSLLDNDFVTTGFNKLNHILNGGFYKKQLVVIGARPSVGKTSIAQQMILKASDSGKKCLFISLEVDKKNVFLKFVSNMVSIDGYKLQIRKFNQSELESIKQAKKNLRELNIYVNDSSSLNVSQIENIIKKQLEIEPVDMVFIDYIQIIRFLNQGNFNEASAIKENTSRLKEIAKKYNVGVVALAQISRKGVENNQEPTVNDLKGSGGIEEDADVAILLHRDKNQEESGGYFSNNGKLIIAKNRYGATGVVGFEFEGKFSRFTESVNNF